MKINVPEKYADLYIKALVERKQVLQGKIAEFRDEIAEIDNHIRNLTSIPIFNDGHDVDLNRLASDGYRNEWPWTKKIAYFEQQNNKIFMANEVVDFILNAEPELEKNKIRSSVSAALSNWVRSKKYQKFVDPVASNSYYGPSEWFLSNSNPQIDFMPVALKNRLLRR